MAEEEEKAETVEDKLEAAEAKEEVEEAKEQKEGTEKEEVSETAEASIDESLEAEEEKKEEIHEAEEELKEEAEEEKAQLQLEKEEEAEEDKKESRKEKSKAKKAEPQKEDEFMAMMREEEEEKKAALEKREEEAPHEEAEPVEEEIGLIKKKEKKQASKSLLPQKSEAFLKPRKRKAKAEKEEVVETPEGLTEESAEPKIYALRTTANREDQVMDFLTSNAARKKLEVFSVIRPHGMRGYIFVEAATRNDAEQAAFGVPYARGLLPSIIQYAEIEHMLEQVKKEANIQKNDIAEIISGPFKREKAKITRIDRTKEEVVVELLEAAVPIPLTLKIDAVRVIRRDSEGEPEAADK
ncbi:MAG TPA: transcription elongation factor Spt5 [Candidatus Nanoarchaeia archaeon]|nr:transcription elongation factor Spt5 [Candidatus Nanoarchaeia archaeon]